MINKMNFSCKITNSVLSFLEASGDDLSPLIETSTLPEEFLKDTSYWLKAQEMEHFLSQVVRLYQGNYDVDLLEKIGHQVPELRSWGLLDSVLRMMPEPQEILSQPERFLGYFISPEPPLANLIKSSGGIQFDLPISSDLYPLTTHHLSRAFETLPLFVGQGLAECRWSGIHVQILWNSEVSIFSGIDPGHQISPDLLRTVMATLEKTQQELQQKNKELQERSKQVQVPATYDQAPNDLEDFVRLKNQVSRLSDYLVRAQQVISLLTAMTKTNPMAKEILRRVDWEYVTKTFPASVQECYQIFQKKNIHDPLVSRPSMLSAATSSLSPTSTNSTLAGEQQLPNLKLSGFEFMEVLNSQNTSHAEHANKTSE